MVRIITICPKCELHFLAGHKVTYCPACHEVVTLNPES